MLCSRSEGDEGSFFSIALQAAAAEARQGHRQIAEELRAEVDKARAKISRGASVAIPFASPRASLEGPELRQPRFNLKDVVSQREADLVHQRRSTPATDNVAFPFSE
jgi:hypothetical protein